MIQLFFCEIQSRVFHRPIIYTSWKTTPRLLVYTANFCRNHQSLHQYRFFKSALFNARFNLIGCKNDESQNINLPSLDIRIFLFRNLNIHLYLAEMNKHSSKKTNIESPDPKMQDDETKRYKNHRHCISILKKNIGLIPFPKGRNLGMRLQEQQRLQQ